MLLLNKKKGYRMEDFIIWDSKYKLFLDENFLDTLQENGIEYEYDNLYYGDEYYPICVMDFIIGVDGDIYKDRISKLFYVGLKDINNNKIYADCSILRVNYFHSLGDWISGIGYFSFDEETLRYCFTLINEKEIVAYDPSYFDSLEIIDTIQENKLGLIK